MRETLKQRIDKLQDRPEPPVQAEARPLHPPKLDNKLTELHSEASCLGEESRYQRFKPSKQPRVQAEMLIDGEQMMEYLVDKNIVKPPVYEELDFDDVSGFEAEAEKKEAEDCNA